MRGGDIAVLSLDDADSVVSLCKAKIIGYMKTRAHGGYTPPHKVEVEGTVEPGILSASWSPDDSLLALVTGKSQPHWPHLFVSDAK
jgi:IKI3 family